MKALILAGGQGKRLAPLTHNIPKCLLEIGGKTILEHMLDVLVACGKETFTEIIIVSGFHHEKVIALIGQSYKGLHITHCVNTEYPTTNTLYGLFVARDFLNDAFIQIHGDLLFHKDVLQTIISSPVDDAIVISSNPTTFVSDGNRVKVADGRVSEINKLMPYTESEGRAFGIYKFSQGGAAIYMRHVDAQQDKIKEGFEIALRPTLTEVPFGIIDIQALPFAEIDDVPDFERAKNKMKEILT